MRTRLSIVVAALAALSGETMAQCTVQKLVASDGVSQQEFGEHVAIGQGVIVVGVPSDDEFGENAGAAYLFMLEHSRWIEVQKFTALEVEAGDRFGTSVALAGPTIVVGAPGEDEAGPGAGAAYVFETGGSGVVQVRKLLEMAAAGGRQFGTSVAASGETLLVGAIGGSVGETGAATAFVRAAGKWTAQAVLTAEDGEVSDRFCDSLALDGDQAVIGAPIDDFATGAAYVFARTGTTWRQQQKLVGSDSQQGEYFGGSVDIDGDTILAGAYFDDGTAPASGLVYVFERENGSWIERAPLAAMDGQTGDFFGISVALSGDRAVVGATLEDALPPFLESGESDTGAVYVFLREGSVWRQTAKWVPADIDHLDRFGTVALSGERALVGAALDDDAGFNSGSAYVFELGGGHETYCTSTPSSTGAVVHLTPTGTFGVAANGFGLRAEFCPSFAHGQFFYGQSPAQTPFANGVLCIAPLSPGIFRLSPAVQADLFGTMQVGLDFDALNPPGAIEGGSTWNFQLFFRDGAAGGSGFNLSDAIAVTFCP